MKLANFILPLLSSMSLIAIYGLILYKRHEKMKELAKEDATQRDIFKIEDYSEGLWWNLSMVLVLLTYFGFVLLFLRLVKRASMFDAMVVGLIIFTVLFIIGRKMTSHGPKKSTTKIMNE